MPDTMHESEERKSRVKFQDLAAKARQDILDAVPPSQRDHVSALIEDHLTYRICAAGKDCVVPFGVRLERDGFIVDVKLDELDDVISLQAEIIEIPEGEEITLFLSPIPNHAGGWMIGGVAEDGRWYWGDRLPEKDREYHNG